MYRLMFGEQEIGISDMPYAVGAVSIHRYLNGTRYFKVVSVDHESKICRVVEVIDGSNQ